MAFHQLMRVVAPQRLKVDGTSFQIAAGTTALTSNSIDTQANGNFCEGVCILLHLGAITATGTIAVVINESSDNATWSAVGSTYNVTAGMAQTIVPIDIYRPKNRYLQVVCTRATANSAIDSLTVLQYKANEFPPANDGTIQTPVLYNNI